MPSIVQTFSCGACPRTPPPPKKICHYKNVTSFLTNLQKFLDPPLMRETCLRRHKACYEGYHTCVQQILSFRLRPVLHVYNVHITMFSLTSSSVALFGRVYNEQIFLTSFPWQVFFFLVCMTPSRQSVACRQ